MLTIEHTCDANVFQRAECWDRLAGGNPLQQSGWLSAWWDAFGNRDARSPIEPYIITARDAKGQLVAALPLVRSDPGTRGELRALGQGDACTDYVTILALDGIDREGVARQMGRWLAEQACTANHGWRRLWIDGIVDADPAIAAFAAGLSDRNAEVRAISRVRVWRLDTARQDWSGYLATMGKSNRRALRTRLRRVQQDPRFAWQVIRSPKHRSAAVDQFMELHQRRWRAENQPGCFAKDGMQVFLQRVASNAVQQGRLILPQLLFEGRMAAAALLLQGDDDEWYYYCTAFEIELADWTPGHLFNACLVHHAFESSCHGLRLLRGDETYKQRLQATPRRLVELHAHAPSRLPALTDALRTTAFSLKERLRESLGRPTIEVIDLPTAPNSNAP